MTPEDRLEELGLTLPAPVKLPEGLHLQGRREHSHALVIDDQHPRRGAKFRPFHVKSL
ncbi:hypothetical protein SAMN05216376_102445 [Mameliella alba]|uniref:hypothetical protein n=1 Tax=Mameliella alba TaxID=561184 RepID=UPI00088159BC|nr:hypothetical protein [Mameliella alba]PTR41401.1 hypothetical protein LX94_00685 [Mameliella alba]GGF51193.1 hypothetical protein GCM10011319_10930 [Mameliella alba]SDC43527.1 hypothetical protein SAMN05216376_102445 [Mameliella alba]